MPDNQVTNEGFMQAVPDETLVQSIPDMDREHAELIAQEREFSDAVDAEASRAELTMRLSMLIDAFQNHFASEEKLMRTSRFPASKPHIAEHRRLIAQMTELRDDLDSGAINRCYALVSFLHRWSEQHMTGPDAGLAHYLDRFRTRS